MAKKKTYGLEILISGETDASLAASIKKAKSEISALERKAHLSGKAIEDSFGGMSIKGIDALGSVSDKVFGAAARGGQIAAAGIAAAFGASTAIGTGFESQMSTVQAISQASEADMKKLNALAKEMGETTQFTAEEAGQGLEYMAMAGWKTKDMLDGLPGIMYLAAASGEDLGNVSDIVTDALTAFGMQANESAYFADVLAQASASSNTNVGMMGNTFQYLAPVAGALGYQVKDVAVGIGLMANSGIKAEKAGTALRGLLTNLAKPTEQVQGYMEELSLTLADGNGTMYSFEELLVKLRKEFAGLTQAQKAEYAAGLAGKEGMSGLLAMVNASDDDFQALTEAIEHSSGAAQRMAEIRLDNLAGDLTILQSASQGLGIEAYEGFSGFLRTLTQGATSKVSDLTEMLNENMPTIQRHAKNFGAQIENAFGPILEFGAWCADNPNVIEGTLLGIAGAFGTFKAVQQVKNAVKLFGTLSGMVSAWPVAAAGLAIGGIVGIKTAIASAERAAVKANLNQHFGNITLSVEELASAAKQIVSGGSDLFGQFEQFQWTSEQTEQLAASLQSGLNEINKAHWKLSMGFELDESDTEAYVSSVDDYIKHAQEYISSSGYELELAVGIVFGKDSEAGTSFSEGSNAFYQSLYQQLQPLEENLQEVMTDITANGLDLPKQQLVDSYLGQISEITAMITDAENAAKMQMIQMQYTGADMLSGDTFQNLQQSIQEYTDEANAGIDESYQKILTSLNAQRLAGERGMEGGISREEFDAKSSEALEAYYHQQAEVLSNGYQLMRDAILSAYGEELNPAMEEINQRIQESLPQIMENNSAPAEFAKAFQQLVWNVMDSSDLTADAKGAIQLLMENMLPTQEDLVQLQQQMEASGFSASQIIIDALGDMAQIRVVTGDEESIWSVIGDKIADNEEYALLLTLLDQRTGQIPDTAIEAITARNKDVEAAAGEILQIISDTFASGVQAEIPISLETVTKYRAGTLSGTLRQPIEHHAAGGLMEKPTLSWFAENSPEMAIPIDGSRRALGLWQETGRMLGAYDFNGMEHDLTERLSVENSHSFAPVFSPVIQVQSGSEEQLKQGLYISYEQFVDYMERFQREQYRAAF